MSKKKTTPIRRHFPWLFLSVLLGFSIWMTYLYGVFYIPSLPREEIPPFLQVPMQEQTEESSHTAQETSSESVQPPKTTDSLQTGTQQSSTSAILPTETMQSTAAVSDQDRLYTRRDGVYNILCAGRDEAAFNTDVLMLVSFDTPNGQVSVVQIPRDTYLDG